jgi:Family of unknown function (DUF6252)
LRPENKNYLAMKKINVLTAFILLFAAIGFTSCDTEPVDPVLIDDDGGQQPTGPAVFKVDFSGDTYVADQATAAVNGNMISVAGIKMSNGSSFAINIPGTSVGTYNGTDEMFPLMSYHPTLTSMFMYMNVDPTLEVEDPTGSVTITSINTTAHTISGTFTFTGYWSDEEANQPNISFTNGSFQNIPYTGNIGTDPDPDPVDEEYYRAKVNGVLYDFTETMTVTSSGGKLGLVGLDEDFTSIILTQDETLTPGTYAISDNFLDPVDVTFSDGENDYEFNSGTMTIISKENGWIKGTFSFTMINLTDESIVEITGGEFFVEML